MATELGHQTQLRINGKRERDGESKKGEREREREKGLLNWHTEKERAIKSKNGAKADNIGWSWRNSGDGAMVGGGWGSERKRNMTLGAAGSV